MNKLLLSLFVVLLLTGCTVNNDVDDQNDQQTPDISETDKDTKPDIDDSTSVNDTSSMAGMYIETYTDKMPEDWKRKNEVGLSRLILNEDGTCFFIYNNCDAMYVVTPNYEISDDKIILHSNEYNYFFNIFMDHVHMPDGEMGEDKVASFTIVSNDEIYPNFDIGCVYGYEDYQKGYASFKK